LMSGIPDADSVRRLSASRRTDESERPKRAATEKQNRRPERDSMHDAGRDVPGESLRIEVEVDDDDELVGRSRTGLRVMSCRAVPCPRRRGPPARPRTLSMFPFFDGY
jgi:hypothetical protein